MKTLSKEAEAKIIEAIQSVCDLVQSGSSPTDATVKVAQEQQLTPNFIRLVSHGYNTGATAFQRESNNDILGKMAEFPLVDTSAVIAAVYPAAPTGGSREKTSSDVSSEYSRAPRPQRRGTTLEKVAHDQLRQFTAEKPEVTVTDVPAVVADDLMSRRIKAAYATVDRSKLAIAQKRASYVTAQQELLSKLGQLAETVKCSHIWSASDVGKWAESQFGAAGKAVGNFLAVRDPGIKKASAGFRPVDWNTEPFVSVAAVVKLASTLSALRDDYQTALQNAKIAEQTAFAPFQAQPAAEQTILCKESSNFLSGLMLGSIPKDIATALGTPRDMDSLVSSTERELLSSDDENIRRTAATQAMLSDFTSNDDVISGYDPAEVYGAYNEISTLAPRLSTQPAAMRSLLRKRLSQGSMEPFEINEIANMEKTLSEAQNPRVPFDKAGTDVLADSLFS